MNILFSSTVRLEALGSAKAHQNTQNLPEFYLEALNLLWNGKKQAFLKTKQANKKPFLKIVASKGSES